jgi:hypothetical protein
MYQRDSYGIGNGFGALLTIMLTVSLVTFYMLARVCVFLIHTFVKYPRKVVLWVFLAGFVLSVGVGGLLTYTTQSPSWFLLGLLGFLALTLTAYVIELRNSQTLLKQPDSIVQAVLHTNWFGDTESDAKAA